MIRHILLIIMLLPGHLWGAGIMQASDLAADGAMARQHEQTIVVLFSSTSCPYCDAVKSEFFNHLESDHRYRGKIVLREVIIDSPLPAADFAGQNASHDKLADQYGIHLVPTVGFLDGHGNEQARRMVGVANMDFYGWYLDIRIKKALKQIRSGATATSQGTTS